MRFSLRVPAILFLLLGVPGCKAPPSAAPAAATKADQKTSVDLATRNNAIALLDDLLNDEKNLSKLLIIKRNSRELKRLVVNISDTAGDGAKMLSALSRQDPAIDFKLIGLPPGERETRRAIAKTKQHLLLHTKEAEFEFQLLLTQSEALNYGAHLALVASENEPRATEARELSKLSTRLQQLHEQVLEMLRHPG